MEVMVEKWGEQGGTEKERRRSGNRQNGESAKEGRTD